MPPESDRPTLVRLTLVGSESEAQIICAILRDAGINAFLPRQSTMNMLPHLYHVMHPPGAEVLVPADQLDEAREILEESQKARKQPEPDEEAQTDQPDTLPPAQLHADKAMASVVLSLLLPPLLLLGIYYACRTIAGSREFEPHARSVVRSKLWVAAIIAVPILVAWVMALAAIVD